MPNSKEILSLLNESLPSLDDRIESTLATYGIKRIPTPISNLPKGYENSIGFLTENQNTIVVNEYKGSYSMGVISPRLGIITGRPTGYQSLEELLEDLPDWLSHRGFINRGMQ
jgi:hypothetical protein